MSREYPSAPLVGVGVVVLRERQVLLVRRGNPPLKGAWSIPGGMVELGERGAQAAAREVHEETGLHVAIGPLLTTVERIDYDDAGRVRYHYVLLEYLARWQGGEPQAASDATAIIWAAADNLVPYGLWAATYDVIRLALERSITDV